MKSMNNKSGFTLIEIIVVMIIIGILAAIALPNIFNNVNTSKGVQALASASSYKTPIETCMATKNAMVTVASCDFTTLFQGINTSNVAVGSGFDVVVASSGGTVAGNNVDYKMTGVDSTGVVAFTLYRQPNGAYTCTAGAGIYASVC